MIKLIVIFMLGILIGTVLNLNINNNNVKIVIEKEINVLGR